MSIQTLTPGVELTNLMTPNQATFQSSLPRPTLSLDTGSPKSGMSPLQSLVSEFQTPQTIQESQAMDTLNRISASLDSGNLQEIPSTPQVPDLNNILQTLNSTPQSRMERIGVPTPFTQAIPQTPSPNLDSILQNLDSLSPHVMDSVDSTHEYLQKVNPTLGNDEVEELNVVPGTVKQLYTFFEKYDNHSTKSEKCYLDGRYFWQVLAPYGGLVKSEFYIRINQEDSEIIEKEEGDVIRKRLFESFLAFDLADLMATKGTDARYRLIKLIVDVSSDKDSPSGSVHANLIYIDTQEKEIVRFEPLVGQSYTGPINRMLKMFWKALFPEYSFKMLDEHPQLPFTEACPSKGMCAAYVLLKAMLLVNDKDSRFSDDHEREEDRIQKFADAIETEYGEMAGEEFREGNPPGGSMSGYNGWGGRHYYHSDHYEGNLEGHGYRRGGYWEGRPWYYWGDRRGYWDSNGVWIDLPPIFMEFGSENSKPTGSTLFDILSNDNRFTTLTAIIKAVGATDALQSKRQFTIFAPTDKAFSKLSSGTIDNLLKNIPKLKKILFYHIVRAKVKSKHLPEEVTTAEGNDLHIFQTDKGYMVENAHIIMSDINASNGVIHVIDEVLMPRQHDMSEHVSGSIKAPEFGCGCDGSCSVSSKKSEYGCGCNAPRKQYGYHSKPAQYGCGCSSGCFRHTHDSSKSYENARKSFQEYGEMDEKKKSALIGGGVGLVAGTLLFGGFGGALLGAAGGGLVGYEVGKHNEEKKKYPVKQ